ncbi:MAG: hypothetical protein JOZ83_06185 [Silvibacterium sp.]|nr:hypothetical protein [Silvibacterium sp.]
MPKLELKLAKECGSNDRNFGKHIEQPGSVELKMLPQPHGLGNRLHAHAEQQVYHQLHADPRSCRSHQEPLPGY